MQPSGKISLWKHEGYETEREVVSGSTRRRVGAQKKISQRENSVGSSPTCL